jgi:hypothetical protein
MKKPALSILALVLLSGCISKSKYAALETRHAQALNEKSGLEEVLTRLAVENDSLKRRNDFLDSLYRTERERSLAAASAVKLPAAPVIKTKTATLPKSVEYDKKALYVYNLPNYIFWPRNVKADKFLIGIVGESALKGALAANVYGKKINDLPAVVEPYAPAAGKFYHMIFVAESRQKDFNKLKKDLKDQPVLLIAENPYLEKVGAHICFYVDGDKVKFNVNKKHIEKSGLNVSEQLIKFSGDN